MILEAPLICMYTVNYIVSQRSMTLGAGGIVLIGHGYTMAPSYAFQMNVVI